MEKSRQVTFSRRKTEFWKKVEKLPAPHRPSFGIIHISEAASTPLSPPPPLPSAEAVPGCVDAPVPAAPANTDYGECEAVEPAVWGDGQEKHRENRLVEKVSGQVTFFKRKTVLRKKAAELPMLRRASDTIVDFCEAGKAFAFGSPSTEAVPGCVDDAPVPAAVHADYVESECPRKKRLRGVGGPGGAVSGDGDGKRRGHGGGRAGGRHREEGVRR